MSNISFANALIEALSNQRNEALNALAQSQATATMLGQENQFLRAELEKLREAQAQVPMPGLEELAPASAPSEGHEDAKSEAERRS